jgi:hypothetical protein
MVILRAFAYSRTIPGDRTLAVESLSGRDAPPEFPLSPPVKPDLRGRKKTPEARHSRHQTIATVHLRMRKVSRAFGKTTAFGALSPIFPHAARRGNKRNNRYVQIMIGCRNVNNRHRMPTLTSQRNCEFPSLALWVVAANAYGENR